MGLWMRWSAVATVAVIGFGLCWWLLQSVAGAPLDGAVGVASLLSALVLTLGGAWASRARSQRTDVNDVDTEDPATALGLAAGGQERIGYRLRGNAKVRSEHPRIRNQDVAFDVGGNAELNDRDADIR
jgi:hypothetical protein